MKEEGSDSKSSKMKKRGRDCQIGMLFLLNLVGEG